MIKKSFWLAVATLVFAWQIFVSSANAAELTEEIRTVDLNVNRDTVVLSLKQLQNGKRLFNYACAQCHVGGTTKTNPNVDLSLESLALAFPPRDNIEGLVDYMNNPTTYDGEIEISELHPSTKSADIFTEMRNLTDDDLVDIAGHILIQPRILGKQWGSGKTYR
ncbi:photosystem II cytochrome c-550 [Aerosakkonemataceae cyanobacterium BLCC-F154]|uniref:Photosystem II extrinsic protein V n=1 Tax=Floridaenema fluviatile BLCC-F154 TaxID=3153640 RepID=A0ABV4YAG5_9CYAN